MNNRFLKLTALSLASACCMTFAACSSPSGTASASSGSASSVSTASVSADSAAAAPAAPVTQNPQATPVSPDENVLDEISSSETYDVESQDAKFKFEDISWDAGPDDLKSVCGDPIESSESDDVSFYTYRGCELNGYTGAVKAGFDKNGKLLNLEWKYEAASKDDLLTAMDSLSKAANDLYGEPIAREDSLEQWVTDDQKTVEIQAMKDAVPLLIYRVNSADAFSNAAV